MFKSELFKSRRILLGNCIFGILYAATFALINFAFLNFKVAMVISIIFATGVLKPVFWMLKVDNAVQRYIDNARIRQEIKNKEHAKSNKIQCESCCTTIEHRDTYIQCKKDKIFCDLKCSFDCEYEDYTNK